MTSFEVSCSMRVFVDKVLLRSLDGAGVQALPSNQDDVFSEKELASTVSKLGRLVVFTSLPCL